MRPTIYLPKSKSASASSNRWKTRQSNDPFVKARTKDAGAPAYRSRASFKLLSINKQYPFLLEPPRSLKRPPKVIVDLGAAPGGWSQAASTRLGDRGRVFALDILPFEPIPYVESITGDFLDWRVQEKLRLSIEKLRESGNNQAFGLKKSAQSVSEGLEAKAEAEAEELERREEEDWEDELGAFGAEQQEDFGLVDVVLSDMMGSMSGNRLKDTQTSLDLVQAASTFASRVLKNGAHREEWTHMGYKRYPGGHFV